MEEAVRVFIVSDHPIIGCGLALLFQEYPDIEVIGEARHHQNAIEDIQRIHPDVVLIDIETPEPSILYASRRISNLLPGTAAVVLLTADDEDFLVQAIQANALGYMSRKGEVSELMTAIRTVYSGQAFIHTHLATNLVGTRLGRRQDEDAYGYGTLTSRERQVLPLLAQGYTNQEVADMLTLSPHTIQTYRQHIMRKLDIHRMADLLRFALLRGLINLE